MAFALKLYNLSSMWHNNIHTAAQVYKFKHAANNALMKLLVYTRIKHDHDTPKTSISGGTIGQLTKQLVMQLDGSKTLDMRWSQMFLR